MNNRLIGLKHQIKVVCLKLKIQSIKIKITNSKSKNWKKNYQNLTRRQMKMKNFIKRKSESERKIYHNYIINCKWPNSRPSSIRRSSDTTVYMLKMPQLKWRIKFQVLSIRLLINRKGNKNSKKEIRKVSF